MGNDRQGEQILFRRCPYALMQTPGVIDACHLYGAYKRGVLPNGRGLNAETAFFVEAMQTLEALESEAESWYLKESSRDDKGH